MNPVIPPAVLERGERAIVNVLRRCHPDALFLPRDRSVRPEDADAPGEIGAGTPGDLDPVDESGEDVATIGDVVARPEARERSADGEAG